MSEDNNDDFSGETISFTVSEKEYKEAGFMAKGKGFSSVEDLMKNKYQKFMKIHRNNIAKQED